MADNTRMKELQAKVETLFTLMDHNEQRFKTIEQSLITLPMIQQSLAGISQMLESTQIHKHSGESSTTPTLVDEASQITVQPSLDAYSVRNIKIDFPRFGGIDALNWIFQAEQFFEYYGVPDQHRLRIASVHFDGPVVPWYQRLQKAGKLTSWGNLTKSLECTYGPPVFESPRYSLFRLTQESTVAEFYAHITVLANRVNGVPEDVLMDCFIGGLKKELQAEVIPWDPDDLDKAVTLAKLFDEKLQFGKKASFSQMSIFLTLKLNHFRLLLLLLHILALETQLFPRHFARWGFKRCKYGNQKGYASLVMTSIPPPISVLIRNFFYCNGMTMGLKSMTMNSLLTHILQMRLRILAQIQVLKCPSMPCLVLPFQVLCISLEIWEGRKSQFC